MIYTVTLNPSLDYIVSVTDLNLGTTNRTTNELLYPGGKGINVSIVLNNLGIESKILGFTAGFTGREIRRKIKEIGLSENFIDVNEGMSRINIKIRSNEETEVNGMGPKLTEENIKNLYEQLDALTEGDVLVLSGSIPSGLSSTLYQDIMKRYKDKRLLIAVDASKDLLTNVLPLNPFVIKPNKQELEEILDIKLNDTQDTVIYAKKLQETGARNVIVSMAGNGAVLVTEDGDTFYTKPPVGKAVNSVGAGDSMLAGFLYGYLTFKDYEKAFYYSVCTGSASAFSEGLATKDAVERLLAKIP
ncbi:MAG: 1-phosphofructokinase [Lachnospiraceae bacterium]|nr:1-phosphofructokinase [Lachnospiraceae bacterium]